VTLVSSADETAFAAFDTLGRLGMLRDDGHIGQHRFLSSGDIDVFRELGERLLGPELAATERWPVYQGADAIPPTPT
jgi:glutamate racemase